MAPAGAADRARRKRVEARGDCNARSEYACADEVVQAPAPERLIESGIPTEALMHLQAVPTLHRRERIGGTVRRGLLGRA